MSTTKISRQTVYLRVKKVIAIHKRGLEPQDIRANHTLRGDLRFTDSGIRALTPSLNTEFEDVGVRLTPLEVVAAITVRDLQNIIWGKIPSKNRM